MRTNERRRLVNSGCGCALAIGKDDDLQWVSVAVFGKAAETAGALKKQDRVYIEGSIRLDNWTGKDGAERHGLSVAAFKCEATHRIGRNRIRNQETANAPIAEDTVPSRFECADARNHHRRPELC